jgi:hypothetical protein
MIGMNAMTDRMTAAFAGQGALAPHPYTSFDDTPFDFEGWTANHRVRVEHLRRTALGGYIARRDAEERALMRQRLKGVLIHFIGLGNTFDRLRAQLHAAGVAFDHVAHWREVHVPVPMYAQRFIWSQSGSQADHGHRAPWWRFALGAFAYHVWMRLPERLAFADPFMSWILPWVGQYAYDERSEG